MKIDRLKIYNKFGGHCAYCGEVIAVNKFQVDHLIPQNFRNHIHLVEVIESEDNLMPSCCKCNNHKTAMSLETWRREIERHSDMLLKNTQFQRALRYGQVCITKKPVVFYFEQVKT